MSLQQDELAKPGDQEELVAEYLVSHPDFLARHPAALAAQRLQHDSGGVTSLIERQVKVLREQGERYRIQLEELINVARENEQLNQRLHQMTLALMEAASFDDVLNILQDQLRDKFQADAVEMKLFRADELEQEAAKGDLGAALFRDFVRKARPSCGQLDDDRLVYLFGSAAAECASVALVPLVENQISGVLAIGSHDAERFHSGKGLDFLRQLGEIVSRALHTVNCPGV